MPLLTPSAVRLGSVLCHQQFPSNFPRLGSLLWLYILVNPALVIHSTDPSPLPGNRWQLAVPIKPSGKLRLQSHTGWFGASVLNSLCLNQYIKSELNRFFKSKNIAGWNAYRERLSSKRVILFTPAHFTPWAIAYDVTTNQRGTPSGRERKILRTWRTFGGKNTLQSLALTAFRAKFLAIGYACCNARATNIFRISTATQQALLRKRSSG